MSEQARACCSGLLAGRGFVVGVVACWCQPLGSAGWVRLFRGDGRYGFSEGFERRRGVAGSLVVQ